MYEHMTFEKILGDLLARAPANVDTREGSIFYDAVAPAAAELANAYIELDYCMSEAFADTAEREFLIRRCAERGITPQEATNAVLKGVFEPSVPVGSRFNADDKNYVVLEQIEGTSYRVQCEEAGAAGNTYLGSLIPIEYINGLECAALTEVLIPGEDDEDTDILRARYFRSFDSQAFGGNIADYQEKVNAMPGVGAVKVHPVWNGGGTVKLVILSSEFKTPSDELVHSVQTAVDPEKNQGQGIGLAPVDHTVTVSGAESQNVDISLNLTYAAGYDWTGVQDDAKAAIEAYLSELRQAWESEAIIVRISQIEARLLDVTGILDLRDTAIGGKKQNLQIDTDAVPILGSVTDG